MKVNVREERGVAILDLQGRLTIGSAELFLRDAVHNVLNAGENKILINMAGVTNADSSGIGALVSSHTYVSDRGGQLKLENLRPAINELLHITQLITVFEVYDSESDAIESFR